MKGCLQGQSGRRRAGPGHRAGAGRRRVPRARRRRAEKGRASISQHLDVSTQASPGLCLQVRPRQESSRSGQGAAQGCRQGAASSGGSSAAALQLPPAVL